MAELPAASQRVHDTALAKGLEIDIREMTESTRTAEEAAAACGCSVGEIVKSMIFRGRDTGRGYLILVSGTNRVEEKATGERIGEALTRPDADFVRQTTGFAIGGVAPLGHMTPLATFMDEDLLAFDTVWAAAGTPRTIFAVPPRALAEATSARVIRVTG